MITEPSSAATAIRNHDHMRIQIADLLDEDAAHRPRFAKARRAAVHAAVDVAPKIDVICVGWLLADLHHYERLRGDLPAPAWTWTGNTEPPAWMSALRAYETTRAAN